MIIIHNLWVPLPGLCLFWWVKYVRARRKCCSWNWRQVVLNDQFSELRQKLPELKSLEKWFFFLHPVSNGASLFPRWGHYDGWWRRVPESRGSQRVGRWLSAGTLPGRLQLHEPQPRQVTSRTHILTLNKLTCHDACASRQIPAKTTKLQLSFPTGSSTLPFTKASIREKEFSLKTCSQATRWGQRLRTVYGCHLLG